MKATGKLADGTSVSATSPLMYDGAYGYFMLVYAAPSAYMGLRRGRVSLRGAPERLFPALCVSGEKRSTGPAQGGTEHDLAAGARAHVAAPRRRLSEIAFRAAADAQIQ